MHQEATDLPQSFRENPLAHMATELANIMGLKPCSDVTGSILTVLNSTHRLCKKPTSQHHTKADERDKENFDSHNDQKPFNREREPFKATQTQSPVQQTQVMKQSQRLSQLPPNTTNLKATSNQQTKQKPSTKRIIITSAVQNLQISRQDFTGNPRLVPASQTEPQDPSLAQQQQEEEEWERNNPVLIQHTYVIPVSDPRPTVLCPSLPLCTSVESFPSPLSGLPRLSSLLQWIRDVLVSRVYRVQRCHVLVGNLLVLRCLLGAVQAAVLLLLADLVFCA